MIADDLRSCASDNLVETYFRLGLAAPKSGVWEDEGFRACLGGYDHPICNFAVRLHLDPWSARRLQALAVSRPNLYVYSLPGDRPDLGEEMLRRADFREIHNLTAMITDPLGSSGPELTEAKTAEERDQISSFMSDTFFPNQDRSFKDSVRWSTSAADGLDLYGLYERNKITGTVMLSRTPGVLGIYNLSVTANRRRRGVGSSIVRWCHGVALREGRRLALQCESGLEQWYSSFGFRPVGRIKVFSLLRPGSVDIMESGLVL